MSDFGQYMSAQEVTRTASANRNYASVNLELAKIKERLAEIRSQHDPVAKLLEEIGIEVERGNDGYEKGRKLLDRIATYVVFGNKDI